MHIKCKFLFDNQKYYNKDDFNEIDYDDQKELFLRIRSFSRQAKLYIFLIFENFCRVWACAEVQRSA